MEIRFDHYLIRDYRMDDADQLSGLLSDAQLMRYMEKTYTRPETVEFLRKCMAAKPSPVYALQDCETTRLAGHIIFHPFEKDSYEIGWIIAAGFQGRHLAEKATHALIEYGVRKGIGKFVIECDADNAQSAYIARKAGFVFTDTQEGLDVYVRYI